MAEKKVCGNDTEIALLKQNHSFMKEALEKIEEKVDGIVPAMNAALSAHVRDSDAKYATKEEHKANQEKINAMQSVLGKIMWLVVAGVLAAVMKLVINA